MTTTHAAPPATKSSKKQSVEEGILAGLREAVAFERGELQNVEVRTVSARSAKATPAPVYNKARVTRVRRMLELSQSLFAQLLNVSAATVRSWEQGYRVPDGAAARLLQVAEEQPEYLMSKVAAVHGTKGSDRVAPKSAPRVVHRAIKAAHHPSRGERTTGRPSK
jgi:DNA-binding transcriptional regulator YiaG